MPKIKDAGVGFTSADSTSKMESALNPTYFYTNEDFKLSVMTRLKTDFSTVKKSSIIDRLPETKRFDRSFRNSDSDYQLADSEFHWMADSSYNLSKHSPELLLKTKNYEK